MSFIDNGKIVFKLLLNNKENIEVCSLIIIGRTGNMISLPLLLLFWLTLFRWF